MADIIYDAFVIPRCNSKVTEEDVRRYLRHYLGFFGTRKSREEIEIFYDGKGTVSTVRVSWILMTLREIRQSLEFTRLRGFKVVDVLPDFRLPMNAKGKFVEGNLHVTLHRKLLVGRGYLPSINLLNRRFADDFLYGMDELPKVIRVEGDLTFNDQPPDGIRAYSWANGLKADLVQCSNFKTNQYLELFYEYPMDAFQDLIFFNKNFHHCVDRLPGHFFRFRGGIRDGIRDYYCHKPDYCFGEDPIGALFDLDEETARTGGYLPLEMFNRRMIWDLSQIQRCVGFCIVCCRRYQLVGIDRNSGWVAAKCICNDQDGIRWKGESFTRLTLNEQDRRRFNSHEVLTEPFLLQPVLRGFGPLFNDPQDFVDTAQKVYRYEALASAQTQAIKHQAIARVEQVREIERKHINEEEGYVRLKVELSVPFDSFWRNNERKNIASLHVIALKEHDDGARLNVLQYGRALKRKVPVYSVRISGTDAIITTVFKIRFKDTFEVAVGDWLRVFPFPPAAEFAALTANLRSWKGLAPIRGKKKIKGLIHDISVFSNAFKEDTKLMQLSLIVERPLDFGSIVERLDDVYVGTHLYLIAQYLSSTVSTMAVGRVIGFEEDKMTFHLLLQLPQGFDLAPGDVEVEFWLIFKHKPVGDIKLEKKLAVEMERYREHDEEAFGNEEWDPLEIDLGGGNDLEHAVRRFEERKRVLEPNEILQIEDSVANFYKSSNIPCSPTNVRGVPDFVLYYLREFKEVAVKQEVDGVILEVIEPAPFTPYDITMAGLAAEFTRGSYINDFSALDFMLHEVKDEKRPVANPIVMRPRNHPEKEFLLKHIYEPLNEEQRQAIDIMRGNRISLINGPPGTGKSTTAAFGVAALHLEEDGIIVVTAMSNYATNVIYEKLQYVSDRLGMDLKIMRVFACSREDDNEGNTKEHNVLHTAMRYHPIWTADEDILRIHERREQEGAAALTEVEHLKMRDVRAKIQRKVMANQDIIVMTVGACADKRLLNLQYKLWRQGRTISAIVVDEASTLRVPMAVNALSCCPSRVILVGDILQLSPMAETITGANANLDISWMEMVKETDAVRRAKVFVMLRKQYRMSPMIREVVSHLTYEKKLVDGENITKRKTTAEMKECFALLPGFSESVPLVTYTYRKYYERRDPITLSYENPMEVELCIMILKKMQQAGVNFQQVKVICMYDLQIRAIKAKLAEYSENAFAKVDVMSVDASQGKERDFVILSLVRSGRHYNIGFLNNQRRLNVALSRARRALFVLANLDFFKNIKIPFIQTFVRLLGEVGGSIIEWKREDGEVVQGINFVEEEVEEDQRADERRVEDMLEDWGMDEEEEQEAGPGENWNEKPEKKKEKLEDEFESWDIDEKENQKVGPESKESLNEETEKKKEELDKDLESWEAEDRGLVEIWKKEFVPQKNQIEEDGIEYWDEE